MSAYSGRHWLLQIAQLRSPSNDAIGCPSMSAPLYPLRVSLCRKTKKRRTREKNQLCPPKRLVGSKMLRYATVRSFAQR